VAILLNFTRNLTFNCLPISITKRHRVRLKYELFGTAPAKRGCVLACDWEVKYICTEVQRSRL